MSKYRIVFDGKTYEMEVEKIDGDTAALQSGREMAARVQPTLKTVPVQQNVQPATANAVVSPMPGTIIKVFVGLGNTVKKGQAVLVLEAMKMENEIVAPKDGQIIAMHVKQGDTVQGGSVLFEIGE